jgi:hypothetical protein
MCLSLYSGSSNRSRQTTVMAFVPLASLTCSQMLVSLTLAFSSFGKACSSSPWCEKRNLGLDFALEVRAFSDMIYMYGPYF